MKINLKKIKITDFSEVSLKDVEELLKENFEHSWSKEQILSSNRFSIKKTILYEDQVIGFFASEIIFSEASITMIALKKEFQNKGIGKFILNWFLDFSKEKGVKSIWLEVSVNNKKAVRFYKKFGFEVQDIRKNYYKDGSDALIMKFIIFE